METECEIIYGNAVLDNNSSTPSHVISQFVYCV